MEYISSDTNIWLDFMAIDRLGLPFRLPYVYLMDNDAIEDELLNPPDIGKELVKMGLQKNRAYGSRVLFSRRAYGQIYKAIFV